MTSALAILGRQPALGIAELESLYGDMVQPVGDAAALIQLDAAEVAFGRLGGTVKLCQVLSVQNTTNWGQIERYLSQSAPERAAQLPEGKMQIGLSVYGFNESAQRVLATGLSLKKSLKKAGKSVRLTPNQEPALSSAQVAHNHLTGPTGWELVIARDGDQTIIAQTIEVQNIDSYTVRDRGRPKRDTRVGMLPPKLAQIIINLAAGAAQPANTTLLDPFCGTGVVLQEALLMGFSVYGTDLEARMIDYSGENLDWLDGKFQIGESTMRLEQADATSWHWDPVPDTVACETYLGRAFTSVPPSDVLAQNAADCNLIIKKFLRNLSDQIPSGARLCVAVPAWNLSPAKTPTAYVSTGAQASARNAPSSDVRFQHLPLIDQISDLGYNRVKFEHAAASQLLYYREDQVVARELLVLIRR